VIEFDLAKHVVVICSGSFQRSSAPATAAIPRRIQPIDATPFASNLARWNGLHMEGHARTWFTRKQKAETLGAPKVRPIGGIRVARAIEENESGV
jgi:hypothetical protein